MSQDFRFLSFQFHHRQRMQIFNFKNCFFFFHFHFMFTLGLLNFTQQHTKTILMQSQYKITKQNNGQHTNEWSC